MINNIVGSSPTRVLGVQNDGWIFWVALSVALLARPGVRCALANIAYGVGFGCRSSNVDGPASCTAGAHCSPEDVDLIATALSDIRCPNQPVFNEAQSDGAVGGTQISASGKGTAIFYGRLVASKTVLVNCNGTIQEFPFSDPQGCNPPPPPPPSCSFEEQESCEKRDGWFWNEEDCSCRTADSPVLVDVAGNGLRLTNAEGGVAFDLDHNGSSERIAWTAAGADDAFLALDRNDNGLVDNGGELFGNVTAQPPSDRPNGFLALAEFDKQASGGNSDGQIDDQDQVFARLRLWRDENHDGISQAGELFRLTDDGLISISLDFKEARKRDRFGNLFRYRSRLTRQSASAGPWAYDVFLQR